MSENPQEFTKINSQRSHDTAAVSKHGDEHHLGRSASHLDPQAPAFVPGALRSLASVQCGLGLLLRMRMAWDQRHEAPHLTGRVAYDALPMQRRALES